MRRLRVCLAIGICGLVYGLVLHAAASYPGTTKSFTTKTDGPTQTIFAAHINDLQDEVVAIENGLLNGVAHIFKPLSDNTYDLGTSSLAWRDLFVKRNLTHLNFAGTGAAVVSNASKQLVEQALTNGQLVVGSTAAAPVAAALTASTGITVTNGAGTITIAATASGVKAYTPTLVSTTTSAETDVVSWTVGAAEMADGDVLLVDLAIQVRNSTGGAITPLVKFKWGATSATLTSGSWTNIATTRQHVIHVRAQRVGNDLWISDPNTALTGPLVSINYDLTAAGGVGTQVMTTPTFSSSQTVKITVTLAAYNASNNFWNSLAARVHKIASS